MRKKLLPFVFVLLALLVPFAHATTQYAGYNSSNLGSSTCGTNCTGFGATTNGNGQTVQAPFAGNIISAGFYVGQQAPNQIVILSFPAGNTPTSSTYGCTGGNCALATAGQTFTVKDVESLSGVSTQAFNTVTLASPVSAASGQWFAIIFMATTGNPATGTLMLLGASPSTSILNACFQFATTSPGVGSTFTNSNSGSCSEVEVIAGATFQTVASGGGGSPVTQCYGNCGSPAVTLANTNSTHTTNFNSTVTLFYQAQSNLNGFIRNETIVMARNYNNGMRLFSGIYVVDLACTNNGGTPFTAQCPGFLTAAASNAFPGKGKNAMLTNIAISNGQWFGIAVSGSFTGLDLNDTNTSVPLFQNAGITPAQITQSSASTNPASPAKPAVYAFVQGNTVTSSPPPGFTSGGGCIVCGISDFVTALGGGVVGALIGVGVIFGIITGGLLYATRIHHPKKEGGGIKGYGVPMELLTIVFILILIGFSAAGVLPPYIPILIIALVAFFFTQAIFSGRRGTRTDPTA